MLQSRCISILVAVVVLAGATASPVAGQTETIELRVKYQRLETLYYHSLLSTVVRTQLPWADTTVATNVEGRVALRVLEVDPDGTMVVESVIEDQRVTTNGRVADEVDSPVVSEILPDGAFVSVRGGGMNSRGLLDLVVAFPSRPLSVGDSWGIPFSTQYLGATIEVNPTFTLARVERTDAGRVARIRILFEGAIKDFNIPPRGAHFLQASGTFRESGEDIWSVERGRLLQSISETTIDAHFTVTLGGQTVRGHVTSHDTLRLEALPRDKVVAAAVGPDSLIAPGKAVGIFTLGQRMDDLVGKLGSPGSGASAPDATMWGADRGFLAVEANWPNGLAAYLDPQDRSALLGLGIADRRFRTDKGLGFGSTQGAVLFVHGMSPTRVDMTSRSGSDVVQVLIYNDDGIAYAITTEDQRSRVARSRAPVGAVRWIVIFPPGSAGKIFPPPP